MRFLCEKILQPSAVAILAILAMVFTSYAVHRGLWLLPAFAPLAVGVSGQQRHWNCRAWQMLALSVFSALFGVMLVRFNPDNLFLNLVLAMACVSVVLAVSRSNFFLLFPIALLPVYIHQQSMLYVLVVCVYVSLAVVIRYCVERERAAPVADSPACENRLPYMVRLLLQNVALLPLFLVADCSATLFFVVPPLIFAFMELCDRNECPTGSRVDCLAQMLWALLLGTLADMAATFCVGTLGVSGQYVLVALFFTAFAALALLSFRFVIGNVTFFLPSLSLLFFPFLRSGNTSYVIAGVFSSVYIILVSSMLRPLLRLFR